MNRTGGDPAAAGDDLVTIRVASVAEARRLADALRGSGDWLEVVPGMDSVMLRFDAATLDSAAALTAAGAALGRDDAAAAADPGEIEIAVVYGGEAGPDLAAVCDALGLTPEGFIEQHAGRDYTVEMLGFTPGFAYLGPPEPALDVPRLKEPRQRVAAGSIGIAGGRSGVYALPGPGGWRIVGRTSAALFDPDARQPFALRAGMRVRFVPAGGEQA